jgi:hypothetical protein
LSILFSWVRQVSFVSWPDENFYKETYMKHAIMASALISLATLTGCSSKSNQAGGFAKTSFDPATAGSVVQDGQPVSVAGITFVAPSSWTDLGPTGMRAANYAFGPIEGEKDSATMAVYFFGQNSGGGVMDNIERWIGQMKTADGKDPHPSAIQQEITVAGMVAHVVEVAGTYAAGGMMGSPTTPKENYRLTAVVLESPGGNVFFKLTGPIKTAQKMSETFAAALLNMKKSEAAM